MIAKQFRTVVVSWKSCSSLMLRQLSHLASWFITHHLLKLMGAVYFNPSYRLPNPEWLDNSPYSTLRIIGPLSKPDYNKTCCDGRQKPGTRWRESCLSKDEQSVGKSSRRCDPAEVLGTFWNLSLVYKIFNSLYTPWFCNGIYYFKNQRATAFLRHKDDFPRRILELLMSKK